LNEIESKAGEASDPGEQLTDEQLMAGFARGPGGASGDAFQTLFGRYRQPVYGFFRRRVADAAVAEELAQETFLAVLKARGRYEATALFRSYLYGIAFRVLKAHRRKALLRAMFTGKMPERGEPADAGAEPGMMAGLVLCEAVGRLERMDREMVLLREYEELSYAEIADVLRIPVNTVRSRLFRARLALREVLTSPPADVKEMRSAEEHA
jgi:RNA polymerase sigma-70 factor (ECF subfamily)